eukprot:Pgem_evm1s5482
MSAPKPKPSENIRVGIRLRPVEIEREARNWKVVQNTIIQNEHSSAKDKNRRRAQFTF